MLGTIYGSYHRRVTAVTEWLPVHLPDYERNKAEHTKCAHPPTHSTPKAALALLVSWYFVFLAGLAFETAKQQINEVEQHRHAREPGQLSLQVKLESNHFQNRHRGKTSQ